MSWKKTFPDASWGWLGEALPDTEAVRTVSVQHLAYRLLQALCLLMQISGAKLIPVSKGVVWVGWQPEMEEGLEATSGECRWRSSSVCLDVVWSWCLLTRVLDIEAIRMQIKKKICHLGCRWEAILHKKAPGYSECNVLYVEMLICAGDLVYWLDLTLLCERNSEAHWCTVDQ